MQATVNIEYKTLTHLHATIVLASKSRHPVTPRAHQGIIPQNGFRGSVTLNADNAPAELRLESDRHPPYP